ncbi:GDSL esterase/lipase LIP-4 [Acorus gramineus]|uniref:GDSL esterase/lipase LIP-4 n=1 Tax=Acorus gramineus TaxID=55184 RepID=A0AAV9BPP8_ACOGR|nr:GDSL esterase/lipase LIP-4 [Acorus gramineus]
MELRVYLLFLFILCLSSLTSTTESKCAKRPIIFNFGDSNSDTGGFTAGRGIQIGPPYGRLFFRRPSSGRFCDGRLIIDFLCQSINARFLSPYMESLGADFTNGANFAVSGSATLPKTLPFPLSVQVLQFLHFKNRSLELISMGSKNLITIDEYKSALYMIDIGQNDLDLAFSNNLSYAQIMTETIPPALEEIKVAIKTLYEDGGRNFWVHNTGPIGCLPQKLALYKRPNSAVDRLGCLQFFNDAARAFNNGLRSLCDKLRSDLKSAIIVHVDVFTIKYDLFSNPAKYGFENLFMTCCGSGDPPYNYNRNATCGRPAHQVCPMGSRYISWDSLHYAEAPNQIVSSKILSNHYSTPNIQFDFFFHNSCII